MAKKAKLSFEDKIRTACKRKKWWKPHEIQKALLAKYGRMYADSTITAKLRKMGIKPRPPQNKKISTAWDYPIS